MYLDPPFNSDQKYNMLFPDGDGNRAASQLLAFGDTWTWNEESSAVYTELVDQGRPLSEGASSVLDVLGR